MLLELLVNPEGTCRYNVGTFWKLEFAILRANVNMLILIKRKATKGPTAKTIIGIKRNKGK